MCHLPDPVIGHGTYTQVGPDAPLAHVPGYTRREVLFLAEYERIVHLDDLLLRRSLLAHVDSAALDELAGVLAEALGWTPAQAATEAQRARDLLTRKHGMHL